MHACFIFMLICLLAGALGGVLQGLVGVGTGIVVTPVLIWLLPDYIPIPAAAVHMAIATSMATIFFSCLASAFSHHKRGNVQWAVVKKIIPFSMLGSLLGALVASLLSGEKLKFIFVIFMFITAIHMWRKKSNQNDTHVVNNPQPTYSTLATAGLLIGGISSLIGIGGGLLMVPFLHWQHVKMHYAVGTSTVIALPVAFVSTLSYAVIGLSTVGIDWTHIGYIYWPALIPLALAAMLFSPLGAKLSTHVPTLILQRIFAVCVLLMGVRMLY